MLTIGDQFPSFSVDAVQGGPEGLKLDTAFVKITDESDEGKWKIVFFWPKDFTFVCPTEIVAFGKLKGDFADRDAVVYGVSTDSEFVHLNWRLHHEDLKGLTIPMLADVKRELSEALGVISKSAGVPLRATFIVDPEGIIRFVAVNDLDVGRNPAEVLRVLDGLQSDELCPCNWQKAKNSSALPHKSVLAAIWGAITNLQLLDVNLRWVAMSPSVFLREQKMTIEALKERLPDYAKDIKLNLGTLAADPGLSTQQRAGTFVVSALASRNAEVSRAIVAEFGPQLSPEALTAAKAAAAIMGMNNIYYRFVHLVGGDYEKLPARLRMNVIGKPGVEKVDFELWSLAVSAVNGCGMCLTAHEKVVREGGLSQDQVQAAVRIAAVVHAVAAILDGEDALAEA